MHLLVLSAFRLVQGAVGRVGVSVSMHLLVLSAFRPSRRALRRSLRPSLNAPFGAQCFPTQNTSPSVRLAYRVSMHLLVLSAFRR